MTRDPELRALAQRIERLSRVVVPEIHQSLCRSFNALCATDRDREFWGRHSRLVARVTKLEPAPRRDS